MFRKIAERLAGSLVTNGIIPNEHQDAYIYGLELLFPQILFYLGILTIAILTKTLLLSLAFIVSYKVLRQYTGGFHCKSAETCLAVSIVIFLPVILFFNMNWSWIDITLLVLSSAASIVLFRFSPVEDKNKQLDGAEKRTYRKLSVFLTAVAVFAVLISFILNIRLIFCSVSWSLSVDAVLIILKIRRDKYEENNIKGSSGNGGKKHFQIQ